ncbi:MAG: hypothetical protein ABJH28_09240 [Paraglaciecola sp.]|uniref:hypothetical protein n=1 Tax=Paraglaciecola sp. TaxID=1920173 RepID=UPI003262E877
MKKIVIAILLFLSFNIFAAGVANTFTVGFVRVDKSGKGYVQFTEALTGTRPACSKSNYSSALAFDTTSEGGKSILSVAFMAKATGSTLYVVGTNTCDVYGVMEDWSYGRVE